MDKNFKNLGLDDKIIKALDNLGYTMPSDVQREAIPYILNKKDIIVKSKTGSGKTAAFGIPTCEIVEVEDREVQALILVPTRELAIQVKEEIGNIGRIKKVRVAAIFGKQPYNEQIRELKQRVHVVVGTPGRVIDHIKRGTLNLDSLKLMIVDEGDKMLNMGFIDQIQEVFDILPSDRTTALFSATIPEQIEKLCSKYMKNAETLSVKAKLVNEGKINETKLKVEPKNKLKMLWKVLYGKHPESAIVFCNTKGQVKDLVGLLKKEAILVDEIHGDMEQKKRIEVMNKFKNREFKVLVATDLAARGIHIDHINLVINYEVPMEQDSYVHRIGRTGRAGKEGDAVTFVAPYEEKFMNAVEEYIGYTVADGTYPSDEEVKAGKKIFKESQRELIKERKTKKENNIHKDVVKIHISGGKKKKIRVLDIVGAFSNMNELTGDDLGIIDVQDGFSYIDILNGKGNTILRKYKEITIKGKKIRLSKAKN